MGDSLADDAKSRLRDALHTVWPNLANTIDSYQFPNANPGPLLAKFIDMTDTAEKAMFKALLDCFDSKIGILSGELAEKCAAIDEYDHDLTRARKMIRDLQSTTEDLRTEVAAQKMSLDARSIEISNLNAKITEINNQRSQDNERVLQLTDRISSLSTQQTQHNERILKLQDEKLELQARLLQKTTTNGAPVQLGVTPKPRRTTTNPDKFTAGQQDTAKRQSAYEKWKTQVEQVLTTDAECFPKTLDTLTFVTSLLSGRAWDAVQDGVKKMNDNPNDSKMWIWHDVAALWRTLDKRYILLDSTQAAKNTLDTLYQKSRAYGDFKADFDHYAEKAMLDNRSKVDMLRKRLNSDFTTVIDHQITLPAADDYAGWSNVTDNIARNLQQKEHIAKLQDLASARSETHQHARAAPTADRGDPMELDRIRISNAERKRRTDNDLCMACGEPGHFARDHHREVNPIPMPRRQDGTRGNFRSTYNRSNARGGYNQNTGYGRGGHNGQTARTQPQGQNQQPGTWQWVPQPPSQQPQFLTPQLRAIPTTGYVIGETSSENTSVTGDDTSSLYTAPDAQEQRLKDSPLD